MKRIIILFLSVFLLITCGPAELSPEKTTKIPVTGIILNPCNIKLSEGETKTIVPTIIPTDATNKTIKWRSTNESVVTVSADGTVKALLAGRGALIVAESEDSGKKAYCSVNSDPVFTVKTGSADARYTSAIITGELSVSSHYDEGWIKEGYFLYSRTASTANDLVASGTKSSASFKGKTFSVNLIGLRDGESYYYVACTKLLDKISYGDVKHFTTKILPEVGAVDMGLSVLWRQYNVGAAKPEEYGDYYAWGETAPKSTYTGSNYKFRYDNNFNLTKYVTNGRYGTVDNKTVLDLEDDVAHVKLGGRWRMPTDQECFELISGPNTVVQAKVLNGVAGYLVTSKITSNSIFFPRAGFSHERTSMQPISCMLWSSSLDGESDLRARTLHILYYLSYPTRDIGCPVRAVCEY